MKKIVYLIFFIAVFLLFTYKLTRIPPGINLDESSIGYNASLIEATLHDENGRFLPVFILTIDGKDWKNPVNIYSTAIVFKIFGRSYFNLRLVSVIYAIVSSILFWMILKLFFSNNLSFIGLLLFLSSPSILLQSHLASDNISGLPFFLLWLYFLFSYLGKPKSWKIILSGIFLGISFYAYKGMRAMVPPYLCLSILYLGYQEFWRNKNIKAIPLFLLGVIPFLLPVPWLQDRYAGAVFDPRVLSLPSLFDISYTYLASFDFTFLFLLGDKMLVHSTGRHGMFLLPLFFLFFLGLFQMFKEKKISYYFILAVLVFTPSLLVLTGSVYRASRLMTMIPTVTFICLLGIKRILEIKQNVFKIIFLGIITLAILVSYSDFANYYYGDYPKRIVADFAPNLDGAMGKLAALAKETNKIPYIESDDYHRYRHDINFFEQIYFPNGNLNIWIRGVDSLPEDGLLLTGIDGGEKMITVQKIEKVESGQRDFFILSHE